MVKLQAGSAMVVQHLELMFSVFLGPVDLAISLIHGFWIKLIVLSTLESALQRLRAVKVI